MSENPTPEIADLLVTVVLGHQDYLGELANVGAQVEAAARELQRVGFRRVDEEAFGKGRLSELQAWAARWTPPRAKTLLLYWTGHGKQIDGSTFLLLASDTDPGSADSSTAISVDLLGTALARCDADEIVVLLDACFSGGGYREIVNAFVAWTRGRSRPNGRPRAAIAVISSADYDQTAQEKVFGSALLGILHSGPPPGFWGDQQRDFSPNELVAALRKSVENAAVEQSPQVIVDGISQYHRGEIRIPNPRFRADAPDVDGERLATGGPVAAAELDEHFLLKFRGIDAVGQSGWYFTGRSEPLRELKHWLGTGTGMLIVTGPPGSGKSAILGRTLAMSFPKLRRMVVEAHQLDGLDPATIPDENTIDAGVHAKGRSLLSCIADLADGLGLAAPPGGWSGPREFVDRVGALNRPVTLLLDALDEARPIDALAIARDLLSALASERGVRVVVGTRRDLAGDRRGTAVEGDRQGPLLRALGSACTIDLSTYGAVADIHAYARRRLRTLPTSPYRDVDEATATLIERLSSRVTELSKDNFLVARIVTLSLASRPNRIEADDPSLAGLPSGDLGTALDADLSRYGYQEARVRNLLGALAWAEGAGLPRRDIWLVFANALAAEPNEYTDTDVVWVLEHAGAYVTQSGDEGETVYRLYHQALQDHFRRGLDTVAANAAIARALAGTVPTEKGGRPEWARAAPYLRRHLAEHALVGAVEADMLRDPRIFEVLDADRLSNAVTALYERTGSEEDLNRAIRLLRTADGAVPTGHPGSARYGEALDLALTVRAERTDLTDDGNAVAQALRAAAWDDLPADSEPTIDVALAMHARYERSGDPSDLGDAIAMYRQALALDWPYERQRNLVRTNLSAALQQKYSITGEPWSIDEAIELSRVAARAPDEGDAARADKWFIASTALRLRFDATGSPDDLWEATEFAQAAVAAADPTHARYRSFLFNRASLFHLEYGSTGAVALLNGAVDANARGVDGRIGR